MSASLTILDQRPTVPGTAEEWLAELPGPVLFRVPGIDRGRVRVASGLMHGNEPSGFRAIFDALREKDPFATDVIFFIGAVEAARSERAFGRRFLRGRRDLNRCFRPPFTGVDGEIASAALALMRSEGLEAVVDLHNNTGHNPAYGVGVEADPRRLGLASFFGRRFVRSSILLGSLHEVFGDRPAATIECGRAGDPAADEVASRGLRGFLRAPLLPEVSDASVELLVEPVRVRLRPGVRVAFGDHPGADADLTMAKDVDRHNFQELDAGTCVAWVRPGTPWPIEAAGGNGVDISERLFERRGGELVTRTPLVPIMMTTSPLAATLDCLCYVTRHAT